MRIGVDLVPLGRVAAMSTNADHSPITRILTPREYAECRRGNAVDVPGAAGRLAAKEAVFKLFQAAGEVLPWQGIEIRHGVGGWPTVELTGRAAELAAKAHLGPIEISITHDEPFAIAVACAVNSSPFKADRTKE
ncbi:holo-ACP synthase [Streptomyces sp. 7N604]|uniref:holo-ACP synthase n=1 Tax=Streptomyces sp. 7N604 TaxID=3457415 RepID=UPI003FD10E3C